MVNHSRSYKLIHPQRLSLSFVSVFQAVEELLTELDLDKKSVAVGASRVRTSLIKQQCKNPADVKFHELPFVFQVFMKRGMLCYLEQQRDQQVAGWLVYLQASCRGHLARQKYRILKVSVQIFFADNTMLFIKL